MSELIKCFECADGVLGEVFKSMTIEAQNGEEITIPNVLVHKCNSCGEETIPFQSVKYVDEYIAEATEALTPEQIYNLFRVYNLDQMQLAEALGLGSKTYHRWQKGTQRPSRSMGYYLRTLAQFPEAFEWVKSRKWRENKNGCSGGCHSCQADCTRFAALTRKFGSNGRITKKTLNLIPFMEGDISPVRKFALSR